MNICIFGSASNSIDPKFIKLGESLGESLAKKGHKLVYGAGSSGMMGAVARGFKNGGGKVLGVIPKFFEEKGYEGINYECDRFVYTQSMSERKALMSNMCDAYIVVPGGIGTFEEFFEVLTLKQLNVHRKAIVVYDMEGYYEDMNKMMQSAIEKEFVRDECEKLYVTKKTEEEVINYIEKYTPGDINWGILK